MQISALFCKVNLKWHKWNGDYSCGVRPDDLGTQDVRTAQKSKLCVLQDLPYEWPSQRPSFKDIISSTSFRNQIWNYRWNSEVSPKFPNLGWFSFFHEPYDEYFNNATNKSPGFTTRNCLASNQYGTVSSSLGDHEMVSDQIWGKVAADTRYGACVD